MARISFRQFDAGLWVEGPRDAVPQGAFRRARGIHHIKSQSLRSRRGSLLVAALANAHSLARLGTRRFQGVGTQFYRDGVSAKTGLDGTRLATITMPPTVDKQDSLLVAGGGDLFKVDTAGAVSKWGIAPPSNGFVVTPGLQKSKSIDTIESQATWTGTAATLADEATIKQQGANSLKMTVAANASGFASKAVVRNLEEFGVGEVSPLEDYIAVWVRIDNPANLESLQLVFDVGIGDFATDTYSRIFPVIDEFLPPEQLVAQTLGLGSLPRFQLMGDYSAVSTVAVVDYATIQDSLGQTTVPSVVQAWVRIRAPKSTFQRNGNGPGTWANVGGVRLVAKANAGTGGIIVYWDDLQMIGGYGMLGTYKYHVTFKNSGSGHRSNPNPDPVEILQIERQPVQLSNLPISVDPQVTEREIWRTVGNGLLFFRVGKILDNSTTVFTDTAADFFGLDSSGANPIMESVELPTDNAPPAGTYDDVAGPYNGRVFWTRDSAPGTEGYVYYSPVGRPESVTSFFGPGSTDDPCQKVIVWNGSLWLFTKARLYQVPSTDEPFLLREIFGAPGTDAPETVIPTPIGLFYRAHDGVRLFNGLQSQRVGADRIGRLFQGEAAENLTAFEGIVATWGRSQFVISDGGQTLAMNTEDGAWRDLGLGCSALFYEEETDEIVAGLPASVVALEHEGSLDDAGSPIAFEIETRGERFDAAASGFIQRVYFDVNTNGMVLVPTIILETGEVALPALVTPSRPAVPIEYAFGRFGRILGVRLAGSLTKPIEVFGIDADCYVPEGLAMPAGVPL